MLYLIGFKVVDCVYAHIDQHFKAVNTGTCCNIDIGILYRDTMLCGLRNGIDFCMNRVNAILFDRSIGMGAAVNTAVAVVTVWKPGRGSVVSG